MPLDKLVLIIVCVAAGLWALVMITGVVASMPYGLPALAVIGIAGYILYRVIRDRLTNAEDDYYEKNVDR